eukprot:112263-Hanusia_phi.AAC.1
MEKEQAGWGRGQEEEEEGREGTILPNQDGGEEIWQQVRAKTVRKEEGGERGRRGRRGKEGRRSRGGSRAREK